MDQLEAEAEDAAGMEKNGKCIRSPNVCVALALLSNSKEHVQDKTNRLNTFGRPMKLLSNTENTLSFIPVIIVILLHSSDKLYGLRNKETESGILN